MKRVSVSQNSALVALFIGLNFLSAALMFFGRGGRVFSVGFVVFMFAACVGLLYAIFFAPTRLGMQEYRERQRTRS